MNKLITLLLSSFCLTVHAQTRTHKIDVDNNFHGVEISAPFEVEIKEGTPAVVATIDPYFESKIKFKYSTSGILQVSTTGNIRKGKEVLKLSVYTNKLDLIEAGSASKIVVESTFNSESLDIEMSSAAKMSGRFNVKGKAKISCSSASKTELTLEAKNINAECSSASKLNLRGECQTLDIEASSASKVDAELCNAMQAKVSTSGASKVMVQAQDKFWFEASGASKIIYWGKGQIESSHTSGQSSISHK